MNRLLIRKGTQSDMVSVRNFCIHTFAWGDYIQDIWDSWLKEGNLLVIEASYPIGICHLFFSKNQVWIEGIRINPKFQRQGLASKLINQAETNAKEKQISFSSMLIDTTNSASLLMAKSLDYEIIQRWNFYSLIPKITGNIHIQFANIVNVSTISYYVKSWRWLIMDEETLSSLCNEKKIIFTERFGDTSMAILTESEHFNKIMIVTLISGSSSNTLDLLLYIQNYCKQKNYKKIQILTREKLPDFHDLDYKITFNLMQKILI